MSSSEQTTAHERAAFIREKRRQSELLSQAPLQSERRWKKFWVALLCVSIVLNLLQFAFAIVAEDRSNRKCFTLDILEAHIKHRDVQKTLPSHRKRGGAMHANGTPLAVGEICFDLTQLTFDWTIAESFSHFYVLREMTLHGPLSSRDVHHAPLLSDMGVHHKSATHLVGSSIIEFEELKRILAHPSLYYVSLSGDYTNFEDTSEAAVVHELGRSRLLARP
jgi:hypothetical protein